jgi:hypothetical protein
MKTSYDKSGVRGQTVKCATGRDDSSYKVNDREAREGREMKGGKDNLSHSLSGASAVQNAKGK